MKFFSSLWAAQVLQDPQTLSQCNEEPTERTSRFSSLFQFDQVDSARAHTPLSTCSELKVHRSSANLWPSHLSIKHHLSTAVSRQLNYLRYFYDDIISSFIHLPKPHTHTRPGTLYTHEVKVYFNLFPPTNICVRLTSDLCDIICS